MADTEEKTWCLPTTHANAFRSALRNGTLDPYQLADMSSKDRRGVLSELVGETHAQEVNALYESKLLLKNQKAGIKNWVKTVAGITDTKRQSLLSKLDNIQDITSLTSRDELLVDLAKEKLGFDVSDEEAQAIFEASNRVAETEKAMKDSNFNQDKIITHGRAIQDMRELVKTMIPKEPISPGRQFLNWWNLPKSLETSAFHFSALDVQAWGMIGDKRAREGFLKMFGYALDPEKYRDLEALIIAHPLYKSAVANKLGLTEVSSRIDLREEDLPTPILEQANEWIKQKSGGAVPNLIKANSRAFVGALNYIRFQRYTDLMQAAKLQGLDVEIGSKLGQDIASIVNNATGRGSLGPLERFQNVAPILNATLFSPRKLIATIQMFNPVYYAKLEPFARREAFKQLAGALIVTGVVQSLASMMGAHVELNPIHQDFGKIQIGDTKLDITGGADIYLRFLARLAMGKAITAKGKELELDGQGFNASSRAGTIEQFFRGKLAPTTSMIADAFYGKDPVGRPFNVSQEVRDHVLPIALNSGLNFLQNDLDNQAAYLPAFMATFGVGLEPPRPAQYSVNESWNPASSGVSVWGEPSSPWVPAPKNVIDKEADKLGINVNLPQKSISGIKLTDKQYTQYITQSGQFAKQILLPMINNPSWDKQSDTQKTSLIKNILMKSRTFAQETLKVQSLGSDNDIYTQSYQKKFGIK